MTNTIKNAELSLYSFDEQQKGICRLHSLIVEKDACEYKHYIIWASDMSILLFKNSALRDLKDETNVLVQPVILLHVQHLKWNDLGRK